jgi:hypothetical protein
MPDNYAYLLRYVNGSLTCCKIVIRFHSIVPSALLHIREKDVLRIFIALKNQSPRPGLNPHPFVQWQAH